MADSVAEAAGSSVEITLKGKTYRLSPLTIGDLADFETWIKSRVISNARETVKGLDPDERLRMLSMIINQAISQEDIQKAMSTASGGRYLLWLSLRKAQPDITLEKLDEVFDVSSIQEVLSVLDSISQGSDQNP